MRIVFLGTPELAVPSLKAIVSAGYDVRLVITQPDRPRGRKGSPQPPPVKDAARQLGLSVYQPESVNADDSIENLKKLEPDVIVVAAFGQILRKRVIEAPKIVCINLHASLLPKYRGAAPIPAAILSGDDATGVTIQKVVRKLDAGAIILQRSMPIFEHETAGELAQRLALIGAEAVVEALNRLESGTAEFIPQDESQVTWAPTLTKEDGLINWRRDAGYIARHVRAMTPWPGAFTFLQRDGGLRITVKRADSRTHSFGGQPGEVVAVEGDSFTVRAEEGSVSVSRLQPAGKREMSASEFIRGYRLKIGDLFAEA